MYSKTITTMFALPLENDKQPMALDGVRELLHMGVPPIHPSIQHKNLATLGWWPIHLK
jgi:hypothetical protein